MCLLVKEYEMKKFVGWICANGVALGLVATAGFAALGQSGLRADEPRFADQLRFVIGEEMLPQMVRLPFFGHLFESSNCACNPCLCQPACHCSEGGEFGVDFDVATGPRQMIIVKRFEAPANACESACAAAQCGTSKCSEGACTAAKQTAAATGCATECCELVATANCAAGKVACGSGACQQANIERLLELVADRAGLAAALESQEAIQDAKTEMFESLAGLLMEKAKLEAKVALQGERDEIAKRTQELAMENARLKAQIEFVSHREEITRQAAKLSFENEKLKLRVVELEQQSATGEEAPRTAKRASASRKAR
jgi:hypothetical protein